MNNQRWILLIYILLCSGCAFFEKRYTPPQVQVPKTWQHTATTSPVNLPHLQWWRQYKQPQLDAMIEKALHQNAKLNISITQIELAHSQLEQIKLSWLPNLAMIAGYSQFPNLGNPGRFAIASPAYIINILQQYKQQQSGTALYQASIDVKNSVKLAVIAEVATSYFMLAFQQESLELYNKLLKEERAYLHLLQSKYRHGLISQDEIDDLQSQIDRTTSQIALSTHQITISQNALRYLFNENPGPIALQNKFNSLNTDAVIPGNIPASVLKARPDVHEAEALLRAAHANVGVVSAALLPSVSLGSYLGTSSTQGGVHLSQAMLTMPAIDMPIFAQIDGAKARLRMFYIHYIDTIRHALKDVSNDLSAYAALSLQFKHNTSAYLSEKKQCALVKRRYKSGLADKGQLLQCQIKLTSIAIALNQNKLEKLLGSVSLFQNLGGGNQC